MWWVGLWAAAAAPARACWLGQARLSRSAAAAPGLAVPSSGSWGQRLGSVQWPCWPTPRCSMGCPPPGASVAATPLGRCAPSAAASCCGDACHDPAAACRAAHAGMAGALPLQHRGGGAAAATHPAPIAAARRLTLQPRNLPRLRLQLVPQPLLLHVCSGGVAGGRRQFDWPAPGGASGCLAAAAVTPAEGRPAPRLTRHGVCGQQRDAGVGVAVGRAGAQAQVRSSSHSHHGCAV